MMHIFTKSSPDVESCRNDFKNLGTWRAFSSGLFFSRFCHGRIEHG